MEVDEIDEVKEIEGLNRVKIREKAPGYSMGSEARRE
jgi:hypothetical protein